MAVFQKSTYHDKANKLKEEQARADPEDGVAKTWGRGSRIRVREKGKKRVKRNMTEKTS